MKKKSKLFREPEHNVYVDVKKLTKEEAEFKAELDSAREQFLKWEKTYKELFKQCPHTVKYDEAGFPYDSRHCHLCGVTLELI